MLFGLKGDSMFIKRFLKKTMKGFVSLLLELTVMVSIAVPFDLSVLADEVPATDYEIFAKLYRIDPSNSDNTNNLELVMRKSRCKC